MRCARELDGVKVLWICQRVVGLGLPVVAAMTWRTCFSFLLCGLYWVGKFREVVRPAVDAIPVP